MSGSLAVLTVLGAALLAFANGANDVSKGVATLAGTGRASYRAAIAWGTLWTGAGAAASLVISVGLVEAFTSAIIGPDILALSAFPLAVASGASAWVMFASVAGLPVSTTHALTGAIVGVAVMAGGPASVRWWVLMAGIAAPLALSPLVSAAIGYASHGIAARVSPTCICVLDEVWSHHTGPDGTAAGASGRVISACSLPGHASVAGVSCRDPALITRFMPADALHWGAAAALSFARGVNDNAKIAALGALGLAALNVNLWVAFGVGTVAMTIGSYGAGLRVTRTLGERVVHMDQETGLAAATVSAALVLAASFYTLPVSTTHVSTGAIVGAGLRQDSSAVRWRRVGGLVSAWIITLPVAAALAAFAWLMLAKV